nr:MAG TPA: hypothetical protein [Caudoviricetes sp.]
MTFHLRSQVPVSSSCLFCSCKRQIHSPHILYVYDLLTPLRVTPATPKGNWQM